VNERHTSQSPVMFSGTALRAVQTTPQPVIRRHQPGVSRVQRFSRHHELCTGSGWALRDSVPVPGCGGQARMGSW
jgi:hypothetical protein